MNKSDFAVIILTHGRHDRVYTIDSLRKSGYTGEIYLLCDDEDKQLDLYKEKYKDKVLVFSKKNMLAVLIKWIILETKHVLYMRVMLFGILQKTRAKNIL